MASARAEELSDKALDNAQGLAKQALPVLRKAFEDQVNEDTPAYRKALQEEGDILRKNLEAELNTKIQAHFEQSSEKYQAILREEFPDLEDPELLDKVYDSFADIMDGLRQEYYNDKVAAELEGISDKYMNFEMAEPPKEGEPSINMQFVASLMYLAAMKIDEGSVE